MVSYSSTAGYSTSSGYQVVGYSSSGTGYSVATGTSWTKSHCCGARKFNQPCSDCPG
jgi:hypothetical protein